MSPSFCSVNSEFGRLRSVLVHRIDVEWDLVPTGSRLVSKFLLEDIVHLPSAQKEHDALIDSLRAITDHGHTKDGVLEFTELLAEILKNPSVCREVVASVCALEGIPEAVRRLLLDKGLAGEPEELAKALIRGAMIAPDCALNEIESLFDPIPNLIFTRDIAAVVGECILLGRPANPIRRREALLARYIFTYHPYFVGTKKLDIGDSKRSFWLKNLRERLTIEGGDIAILGPNQIMIGSGERTTMEAVIALLEVLTMEDIPLVVIVVNLPKERTSMHLDTVFTIVHPDECVMFAPHVIETEAESTCSVKIFRTAPLESHENNTRVGILGAIKMFAPHLRLRKQIQCGGSNFLFQYREQWTDGANMFALAPGLIAGYDRNSETLRMLKESGYELMLPTKFIAAVESGQYDFDDLDKRTALLIPGSELSRGRGGARCLTMPLRRDDIVA